MSMIRYRLIRRSILWLGLGLGLLACRFQPSPAGTAEADPTNTSSPAPVSPSPTPLTAAALPDLGPAPDFDNEVWLNAEEPLTLAALRGRVVLLEFWTFG